MNARRFIVCMTIASLLGLAACATSPEDERKRKEMEADIDDILSYEHDPLEYGEEKSCLSTSEFRSYRALGNRHLLFEGRKGRLWVNVLHGRCPGLHANSVFIMRPMQANRLCDKDRFDAVDRLDRQTITAPTCTLGQFKPVTEAQVEEIENRLEMR
jgi:hypothetical protein